MPRETEPEVVLVGGTTNRGRVVRLGDTVRRPQRASSAATHALLRHLDDVGFTGAPRFLGIDDQGREVLSFVPGTAITPPYPAWALTDAALVSVAHLLRDYHRAVSTFDATRHTWPHPPPAPFAGEIVSHNDVNLDNVVFRGHRAVALIDFDLAGPGSRIWDVASAARLWAPLRPDRHIDDVRHGRALERMRLFVDSYGLDQSDREALVRAVRLNHDWSYDIIGAALERGHEGFAEYWGRARHRVADTRTWYADNARRLHAAVSRR